MIYRGMGAAGEQASTIGMPQDQNGAPPVELTLYYDSSAPKPHLWGIPLWVLMTGGIAWAIYKWGA